MGLAITSTGVFRAIAPLFRELCVPVFTYKDYMSANPSLWCTIVQKPAIFKLCEKLIVHIILECILHCRVLHGDVGIAEQQKVR